MRLEYRLDDELQQFPALWNYTDISVAEVVARMSCEYFVKDGETYKVVLTAKEPDGTTVIQVKKEWFPSSQQDSHYSHIGFEIRELQGEETVLLDHREIWNHEECLEVLHSDIIYVQRNGKYMEFALDSREVDEDRKCYVFYGNFTGYSR